VLETVYVSAPQAVLRDRLAAVYNKVATVKNGEALQVLERDRRFLRVRASSGAEGWIEQRSVVAHDVFEAAQKLAKDHGNDPAQGVGITRNDTNIHVEPGRDTDHLYQLTQNDKVSILKRATTQKQLPGGAPAVAAANKKDPPQPAMEDWWLIRDAQGRTGWVIGRLLDLDVPLEIAQYAEGQRIQAYFVLNEVQDGDKKVPEYVVLMSEPKDGMPFDFNQVRVFTWNVRKHRYETAYRERNLEGFFPVTLGHENFEKEGTLPTFTIRVHDANDNLTERKYKLNTPIVRRVLAPGEVPAKVVKPQSTRAGKKRRR
jgi:SH3-like domain-containing protein